MKNAELIARLKEQCDRDAAEHCPAEIIALQAEGIATIEKLEAEVEAVKKSEIERLLRIETKVDELVTERDALQAQLAAAQPVQVNAGYGELEAVMSAEFESHGFGAPESNKREYGRFRVGFASGWHSALTAAKQAQPERAPLSCTWTQEDDFDTPGVYHTSCGEMWSFTEGGIKENNTKFCPHCGGGIKQGGQQ